METKCQIWIAIYRTVSLLQHTNFYSELSKNTIYARRSSYIVSHIMKICIFVGCSNQWQFNQLVRPIKSIKYKSDSTRPQNCNLINFPTLVANVWTSFSLVKLTMQLRLQMWCILLSFSPHIDRWFGPGRTKEEL